MRRLLTCLVLGGCSALAALAACVGDESEATPSGSTSSGGSSGGGSSGVASSSGGSSGGASSSGGSSSGSDGGDGGDATAPYDVRSVKGLKLWLESTKDLATGSSGGASFGTWADQSGAWDAGADGAPDGGRHVAEPEGVNPPTIDPNGTNGRPIVSFTAGNGYVHIANHPDFRFGLGDFIIVSVAKITFGNGPLWQLRPQLSNGVQQQFFPGQLCVEFATANDECTMPAYTPAAGPHVFVARRKSDVFTVRVDGTQRGSLDRTSNPPNLNINANMYAFIGNDVSMQVSEMLIAVGPTTDAELTALEGHLKGKYAIP